MTDQFPTLSSLLLAALAVLWPALAGPRDIQRRFQLCCRFDRLKDGWRAD